MPDYIRVKSPGNYYFFTVVTYKRRPVFASETARNLLRQAIELTRVKMPFEITAFVLLPEHMHCVWLMPNGDVDFSGRWRMIKHSFSSRYNKISGIPNRVSDSRKVKRETGIWQRRFWEHCIRNESDLEAHINYIHYNPVKHALATAPSGWQFSSFHRYVREGMLDPYWGNENKPENMPFETGE